MKGCYTTESLRIAKTSEVPPVTKPLFVSLVVLGLTSSLSAQNAKLNDYLKTRVETLQASTEADLASVTQENWNSKRATWKKQLQQMLGLPPDLKKTRLEKTIVGTIQHDGVSISRLHYQSRPGLYVAANLYTPSAEAPEDGFPAVLYVCGHARVTDRGRLLGNKTGYQHHGLWLARHGFVCLTIDTIQLGELHGEHHGTYKLGRWDWISRGYTPAGVEAWNAIRGIDLLCGLPNVDKNSIGITGRSGGGAYSWFAAALDERIKAAVPVAGITDLRNHVVDGCVEGHCDCMYFVNYFEWDYAKLAALIAPRALMLENSDTDRIFPLDGVVRIDRQLRDLYAQLGASDKYGLVITPGPHKDTQDLRVPAFRFLMKHLQGNPDPVIDSPATKEFAPEQLAVFASETPKDEKVTSASGWFRNAEKRKGKDLLEIWNQECLPRLQELGTIPNSIAKSDFRLSSNPRSSEPVYESESGSSIMQIGDPSRDETMVHLMLDLESWSPKKVAERASTWPNALHYFVSWRGADWKDVDRNTVKKQTQIARRLYLLGESPEELAFRDYLTALDWIASERKRNIRLVASGRSVTIGAIAALTSQSESLRIKGIDELIVDHVPKGLAQSACLPGLFQVCEPKFLIQAAEKAVSTYEMSFDRNPDVLLVDSSEEPQQANGMRIVEVGPTSAKVWVRATRWALPNLGDLPEVQFEKRDGKHSSDAILPEQGVAGLPYATPGVRAEVRVGFTPKGKSNFQYSRWKEVDADSDFSDIVELSSLAPEMEYSVRTQVRSPESSIVSTLSGSFRTLPDPSKPTSFKLAVSTCQSFIDRDGPHGFDMYRTILDRGTDAFVMAGDVVYYDRLARSKELAYYHWQRTYSLPTLVEFHKRVPSFFLKDDHDTYVNDSWPGQTKEWTDDFRFVDGQKIFIQETGLPSPAYRTFAIGSDLQVWLMEGRDFRSANDRPDGPGKTIWGTQQKAWLKETLDNSTAKFRVVISPTPIVGPDRPNKHDNHSNKDFATEGNEVRRLLTSYPNTIAVCGDRHWQFHSIDPDTGLHEFSVGPASDRHAGGWKQSNFQPEVHQYLRVAGGYLELELTNDTSIPSLVVRHLDTQGNEHHRHVLTSNSD